MKRFSKLSIIFALLLSVLTLGISADGVYTSENDPLVSLSYVNDVLGPEIMQKVLDKIDAEYVKISDVSSITAGAYTYLTLSKGQTLMASSSCELIVLNGITTVVVTSAANQNAGHGLSNLTDGSVLVNGSQIPANHYTVIPKGDGRGFIVTSDTANILVRGEHNITG